MTLPIQPPLEPMLSKLTKEIPAGEEWLYEPKWDGFRALVFRDGDHIDVVSRDRKPLLRYFPELADPLKQALPARCVVDGEVVILNQRGLDFDALLLRIHPARSRIESLAKSSPASFVAFDLIALGDDDLRDAPFEERRTHLERILGAGALPRNEERTQVTVTPTTSDRNEAERWFEGFEELGLDGIIAKRRDLLYVPGERVMVKIKHVRTADCVVGGYRLSKTKDGIGSLLLGLYDQAGVLHYVGHTSSFKAAERRRLLQELRPLEGGTSFVGGRAPGGPSRWSHNRDTSWTPLEPRLVCEVAYDHMQGDRFRHATTFLRWRPDRKPDSCTFDQLAPSARR